MRWPEGGHPVADAAGGRDDGDRGEQSGAVQQPLGDGLLEAGIQSASVADGGIARGQGVLDGLGSLQVGQRRRFFDFPAGEESVVLVGQVVVGVNEAGHEGQASEVNFLCMGRNVHCAAMACGHNPFSIQQHGGIVQG